MLKHFFQLTRYLFVGGLTYGADLGTFLLLLNFFGVDAILANLISKVLAGIFSFVAHRAFTFGVSDAEGRTQQAVRYFALLALNIPLSALMLSAIMWLTSMEIWAKVLSDVLLIMISYAQSKLIVFKRDKTKYE